MTTTFYGFVIGITILYFLYYGVLIAQEIIKSKKAGADKTERFDFTDIANDQMSKTVVETEDGKFDIEAKQDPAVAEKDVQIIEEPEDAEEKISTKEETRFAPPEQPQAPAREPSPVREEPDAPQPLSRPTPRISYNNPEVQKRINETKESLSPIENKRPRMEMTFADMSECFEELNGLEVERRICLIKEAA